MFQTLRNALARCVEAVRAWFRPVVVQVRQVVYIQRPALKQSCRKPALCNPAELVKAGQLPLF